MRRLRNTLDAIAHTTQAMSPLALASSHVYYTCPSDIKVEVVTNAIKMDVCLKMAIRQASVCTRNKPCVIGLDTEYDNDNNVAWLQLCVGKLCTVIAIEQIYEDNKDSVALFETLKQLFSLPHVIFVGSGIYECDIQKICTQFNIGDAETVSWLDTQDVAHYLVSIHVFQECKRPGLAGLTRQVLGVILNKDQQCSNWMARQLDKEQIAYAACDSIVSVEILRKMHKLTLHHKQTNLEFGPWLWFVLETKALDFHHFRHKHNERHRKCFKRDHKDHHAKRALDLFFKMDKDNDDVLNHEELCNAVWFILKRLFPGDDNIPSAAFENMIKKRSEMRPDQFVTFYKQFADKMTRANRAYHYYKIH